MAESPEERARRDRGNGTTGATPSDMNKPDGDRYQTEMRKQKEEQQNGGKKS